MVSDTVATPGAEIRAALGRLDLRLRLAVNAFREDLVERASDPFRGLYVTEADVEKLLSATPSAEVARSLLAQPLEAVVPRIERLARLFQLDALEQDALLVCLAPEIDLRYERLYGYLQDDVTKRRPTVDLLLRLLCASLDEQIAARPAFGPSGRLLCEGLLVPTDEAAAQLPLLARPLRVDDRIVEYLLGSDLVDARITPYAAFWPVERVADGATPSEDRVGDLARLLDSSTDPSRGQPILYLHGAPGSGKIATARAACLAAGRATLMVDLPALLDAGRAERALAMASREALLQDAVLGLHGFDRLLQDVPELRSVRSGLRDLLAHHPGPVVLIGAARWEPALWAPERVTLRVELPGLSPLARLQIWHKHVDDQLSTEELTDLATRFRLEDDAIRAVTSAARSRAAWRGALLSAEDLRGAARAISAPPLEGLACRLEPRYELSDIVLPPDGLTQLQELCARVRYQATVLERWGFGRKHARRAGLTALFAGQPGTGKTMAAEIVARSLGLDLYRIDLSAVVSKYIGETEKNLERIFRAADQGDAVLLFDEADALFGKRSEVRDAHDRYANVEIAYLLQRLEAYDGLAILTTNLRGNIDEAFVRRLDCVIDFPLPEEGERLAIWHRALPAETPIGPDVDLPFLACKFKLAGGHIRNIALTAACLAASQDEPIRMRHLAQATRREYQKLGKLVAETDFEPHL